MIRRRYDEFMKTLMQILKSIDGKKLLSAYIKVDKPMIKIMDLEEIDGEIYSNIKNGYKVAWHEFYKAVLSLKPKTREIGKRGIIIGIKTVDHAIYHELVFEDEVIQYGEKAKGYGYSLVDWEEVVGYCVAETRYTRKYIYEIMAQVLHNMSFWGYTKEKIKEERMYIDEAVGGDDNDIESLSSDTTGCSGFPTETDKHYHSIEEKNYIVARSAYSTYLREKEINNLISLLKVD